MRSTPASAAAAFVLVAGLGSAAADDAMSGKINNGSAEIAAPPASKVGDAAAQNTGASGVSADGPPGASPQTIPSTQSAANAADDRLSLEQRRLQLTDAQKQAIRAQLLQDGGTPSVGDPATAQAKVGAVLPSSVTMHDLPTELIAAMPSTKDLKYVRTDKELLLVDPENWMVVGVL